MTTTGIYDHRAEQIVAGCAVATPHGAHLAADRVTVEHFADPRLAGIYQAAIGCPDQLEDDRIAHVAGACEDFPAWVWELVHHRPVMFDTAGSYAARVVRAAARRHRAFALLDQLERYGLDTNLVRKAAA